MTQQRTQVDRRGARKMQPRQRFIAWLMASRLDAALARGESPDSSPLLAFHARVLESMAMRQSLSRDLSTIAEASRHPRTKREERSSMNWAVVAEAYQQLDDLSLRLAVGTRVDPRGVALSRLLLTDHDSPLHAGDDAEALRAAARHAQSALDPVPSV